MITHQSWHWMVMMALLLAVSVIAVGTGAISIPARDIVAARRAGMASVAALWGYREAHEDPLEWNADRNVAEPCGLLDAGVLAHGR